MKKLIPVFIVFATVLVWCAGSSQSDAPVEYEYPYSLSEATYEVTYKGHDYIIFEGGYGSYMSNKCAGVVHNPECRKCLNQDNQ